jgi:hypothetical protein
LEPTDIHLNGDGSADRPVGLLLTCAVAPHRAIWSKQQSPLIRLDQYKAGVASWRFFDKIGPIVVCEASGYPEDQFRAAVDPSGDGPDFEYLSFTTSDESAAQGKGCAELELISNALTHSRELLRVGLIVKATGRYAILNGETFVRHLLKRESPPQALINLHSRLTYADSRVFVFTRAFFFDYLYPLRYEINDGGVAAAEGAVWLEHVLARAALRHIADSGTWDLLPTPPRLRGVSGATGHRYADSAPAHFARVTRHWIKAKSLGNAPGEASARRPRVPQDRIVGPAPAGQDDDLKGV